MTIQFNKKILNPSYKKIWETCMQEGITIPYLIRQNTDREYYPTKEDREKISKKLTKKQHQKLAEAYYNRRLKEHQILQTTNNRSKQLQLIQEYKENETLKFIKDYPKYKEIIIK